MFLLKIQQVIARSLAPLGDRILVRKAAKEVQTAGGIIIPSYNAKSPNEGKVVAVGAGLSDLQGDLYVVESLRNKFPYNFMYGCVLLSDLYLQ